MSDDSMGYRIVDEPMVTGEVKYSAVGPGVTREMHRPIFDRRDDAETFARLLHRAFNAGGAHRAKILRALLGL